MVQQRTSLPAAMLAAVLTVAGPATAKGVSDDTVKIGVIVDMSGVYSANGGRAVVVATQMAVEDFGGTVLGKPIEVISADYQNKVDIASSTVRRWFDQDRVDAIIESTDSASAIAIQRLGAERKRITIAAGSASTALTNAECSPYGIHYVYDTYALATGTGRAIVQEGGKDWYFITADYAFGHSLEKNTADIVKEMGGKVVGAIRHPLNTPDFASFLLQAQGSGAKVVALANAGTDFSTALKQAQEFGLTDSGQSIAAMLVFLSDLRALGLEVARGVTFTTGFYWDYNDETRAFSERFHKRFGAMPTDIQAGAYSAAMTYLNAVKAAGTDDADQVRERLRTTIINDAFAKGGRIRDDGRMVHEMYLAKAKAPGESRSEWDLMTILRPIPGDDAFMPLERSTCPLVRKP